MPLSDDEENYFRTLASERQIKVDAKYSSQYDSFENTVDLCLETIKAHIREAVEARRDALIDTYIKFNKFPNWQDYELFVSTLSLFPGTGRQRFLDYCNTISGPNLPEDSVEELASALIEELNQIISISLLPLRRFIHEGAATRKLGKKINWNIILTIAGVLLTLLGIIISIGTPEVRIWLGLQ